MEALSAPRRMDFNIWRKGKRTAISTLSRCSDPDSSVASFSRRKVENVKLMSTGLSRRFNVRRAILTQ
jgi:hypothetical protein